MGIVIRAVDALGKALGSITNHVLPGEWNSFYRHVGCIEAGQNCPHVRSDGQDDPATVPRPTARSARRVPPALVAAGQAIADIGAGNEVLGRLDWLQVPAGGRRDGARRRAGDVATAVDRRASVGLTGGTSDDRMT